MINHVQIIIRTIPERADFLRYLTDRVPDAIICEDEKRSGTHTFLKALKMSADLPTIHLEDDVLLTNDFEAKANEFIALHPESVIQFFSMRGDDIKIGTRYESGAKFMMNQCFYLPSGMASVLLQFYPTWTDRQTHVNGYDMMMAACFKKLKIKYWVHCPSLVNHRIGVSSLNPKWPRKRQAKTFIE